MVLIKNIAKADFIKWRNEATEFRAVITLMGQTIVGTLLQEERFHDISALGEKNVKRQAIRCLYDEWTAITTDLPVVGGTIVIDGVTYTILGVRIDSAKIFITVDFGDIGARA